MKIRILFLILCLASFADAQKKSGYHKPELSRHKIIYLGKEWGFQTPILVIRPAGWDGLRPLVIFNHAAGHTERQLVELPQFGKLAAGLLKAGFLVAASSLGDDPAAGAYNWGNRSALNFNFELYSYLVAENLVDTERVGMVGNSMGGLVTLLSFPDGRVPVKCAALYYPVTSLRAQYDYNPQMRTGIRFAYNIWPDESAYEKLTGGHDPSLWSATTWQGKRLRFYGGYGDRVVPWHLHGGAFAEYVRGYALESDVVLLNGDHNAGVETTGKDLAAFFGRCFQ